MEQGRLRSQWLRDGGVEDSEADPVKLHGVKRMSIPFALPYWKVQYIRMSSCVPSPRSCDTWLWNLSLSAFALLVFSFYLYITVFHFAPLRRASVMLWFQVNEGRCSIVPEFHVKATAKSSPFYSFFFST